MSTDLILDIGTKSIKSFVFENGKRIFYKKQQTLLGEYLTDNSFITQEGINVLIAGINFLIEAAHPYNVNKIIAFGTEVFRRATNLEDIKAQVKAKTGVALQIIGNQEELERYWAGLVKNFEYDGLIAAIDVGGGSVQFLYGDKSGLKGCHHLKTGTIFVHKQFIKSEPPTIEQYQEIENYIAEQIKDIVVSFPAGTPFIHGSSCVTDFYVEAGLELSPYEFSSSHPYKISVDKIDVFYKKLRTLPEKEREIYFPSDPGFTRGASIGFAQIVQIARQTGLTFIVPSNNSLVHGFL